MTSEKVQLRQKVKAYHEIDPGASIRGLAAKAKCSKKVVETVLNKLKAGESLEDAQRPGRRKLLEGKALAAALERGTESAQSSCKQVAESLKRDDLAIVSPRTVCNAFKKASMKYALPKKVLLLSANQRERRVAFAQVHTSQQTNFRKVMFTDSKIFCLSKLGGRQWQAPGSRPENYMPKNSVKVHAYLGVTYFGPTRPIFVTGGGSQKSSIRNPKTGKPMQGVGSEEYVADVLPVLLAEGDRLFSGSRKFSESWVFQQDNASAHTASMSKGYLNTNLPSRWIEDWPACSPDLSWIENVWAWIDKQLDCKRPTLRTAQDLRNAIETTIMSLPLEHCQNYVRGMQGRLEKVIAVEGRNIGR